MYYVSINTHGRDTRMSVTSRYFFFSLLLSLKQPSIRSHVQTEAVAIVLNSLIVVAICVCVLLSSLLTRCRRIQMTFMVIGYCLYTFRLKWNEKRKRIENAININNRIHTLNINSFKCICTRRFDIDRLAKFEIRLACSYDMVVKVLIAPCHQMNHTCSVFRFIEYHWMNTIEYTINLR